MDCAEAWATLRESFPLESEVHVLEHIGQLKTSNDDGDEDDTAEQPNLSDMMDNINDLPVEPFDFDIWHKKIPAVVTRGAYFDWEKELFNICKRRGWEVISMIKAQIHTDISLISDEKGNMIAMEVDM